MNYDQRATRYFHAKFQYILVQEIMTISRYGIQDYCWLQSLTERRPKMQIMAEILDLCKKPQLKTHVMYQKNLSWELLKKYLHDLQSQEFLQIQIQDSSVKYLTTQKGLQFLTKWNNARDIILPSNKQERYVSVR